MNTNPLIPKNQPNNWLEVVTRECINEYPLYILQNLPDGFSVVDCGCNVGGFFRALVTVLKNKKFSYIGIDASSYNLEQFTQNNPNVKPVLAALYHSEGEQIKLKRFLDAQGNDTVSGNFGICDWKAENGAGWDDSEYELVNSLTLETIVENFSEGHIDFLKVDIEGAEYDFLMNKDLSKVDYITIEIHTFLGEKQNELIDWIKNTHIELMSKYDGVHTNFIKTFKNKNNEFGSKRSLE